MSAAPTGILFYDARAKPLSTIGLIQPGAYYQFYLTGTLTLTNVYADGSLTTPLSQTPGTGGTTAASDGRLPAIYLDPSITYRYRLYNIFGVLLEDIDPFVVPLTSGALVNQNLIGQALYPRTASEISVGVIPTNYIYPSGNILRYGADSSGVSSSWVAFNNCSQVCKVSGLPMIIPPGQYLINTSNGTISLEFVSIVGAQATNIYSPDAESSVLNITGTVNSPFSIRRGVSFTGVDFFYPNNTTDGVTPTVYPPTIIDDSSDGPINEIYIQNCKVFNAYRFFVSTSKLLGAVWITNNSIYGILTCIEIAYNPDSVFIKDNAFSFAVFNAAQLETNPSFRYTTRTLGSAILINQTDGVSITGNVFFGYEFGINCQISTVGGNGGIIQQNQISDNVFDQTAVGVSVSGAGLFTLNTITGNLFSGWDNALHTLIGSSMSITTSGVGSEINSISGNVFSIATGHHINITGNTPSRSYVFSGNTFSSWGTFQSSNNYAAINVSGSSTGITAVGNYVVAQNGAGANLYGFLLTASSATISNNTFLTCFQPLSLSGPGVVIGNQSFTTGTTSSNNYAFPGNVVEVGNKWDKDGQISTGWGSPSGGVVINNFPGASATLVQTSEALAQILTILKSKNIIAT